MKTITQAIGTVYGTRRIKQAMANFDDPISQQKAGKPMQGMGTTVRYQWKCRVTTDRHHPIQVTSLSVDNR